MAGVEGEGKGKKRAREVRDEGAREAREGRSFSPPLLPFRAPFGPFPPILRPATQATTRAPCQVKKCDSYVTAYKRKTE